MASETPPYARLIASAVGAASQGDHAAASDALRAAMKVRFDPRLARALDLVQIALLRGERSVALGSVLGPLIPDEAEAEASAAPETDLASASTPTSTHPTQEWSSSASRSDAAGDTREDLGRQIHSETGQRERSTREMELLQGSGNAQRTPSYIRRNREAINQAFDDERFEEAERLLQLTPQHERDDTWRRLSEQLTSRWSRKLMRRLQPLERVVHPAIEESEFHSQDLDARTMFLYAQVDGRCTIADLVDLSGMSTFDALRALSRMIDDGLIRIA